MSARFAELMAMSAAQTQGSVAATKQILEEKRRREEQIKKQQMEEEKKQREYQMRLARKKLEEEQQAQERMRKQEKERRRREELKQQREEEKRKNLIYGKDHRSGGSSSSGRRGRKSQNGSDDDDDATGGLVLTREEKRQRKLLADLNKSFPSVRKGHSSPSSQALRKVNRALAATDISGPRHAQQTGSGNNTPDIASNILSVRKQLAAAPNTLMRLGTTKRDLRTIDEIVTDLHKKKEGKIIDGNEARKNGFDWFGEQKLKQKAASLPSLSPTPEARGSQSPRSLSKERISISKPSASAPSRMTAPTSQAPERKEPRTKVTIIKPETIGSLSFSKTDKINGYALRKAATVSSKLATLPPSRSASAHGKLSSSSQKKRVRSDSLSDSGGSVDDTPPASKRRPAMSTARNDISSEIWKLFGKDRSQYVQNDVYSDEEDDMEADADALRREELRSERFAKREDELAAEEERRHEEEKRRRKKERERRG